MDGIMGSSELRDGLQRTLPSEGGVGSRKHPLGHMHSGLLRQERVRRRFCTL